jgi:hypothetical protein
VIFRLFTKPSKNDLILLIPQLPVEKLKNILLLNYTGHQGYVIVDDNFTSSCSCYAEELGYKYGKETVRIRH